MNARSTQAVVGLCGNETMITRGRGRERSNASTIASKKSALVLIGTEVIEAPANCGAKIWIG